MGSFQVGEQVETEESGVPGEGPKLQCPYPYLALCISSIWLFLNYILYNKLVM